MSDLLEIARLFYAEELMALAGASNPALLSAFVRTPREKFVGPGPWRVVSEQSPEGFWTTDSDDPRHLYHNLVVALDEARGVNNGLPGLWARLLSRLDLRPGERVLHLGCGTGYYSAIMADLVGPAGKVTAVEIDADLSRRARTALKPWPQAEVLRADGSARSGTGYHALVVSAGAAYPPRIWLDALETDGRLLFPLTTVEGPGAMVLAKRRGDGSFAAEILGAVKFIGFAGLRDSDANARLLAAFQSAPARAVRTLRRDAHSEEPACWLHAESFCLSRREALPAEAKG
jgi:protein-L-isoaspartate(D-aspartate) O-methyltransferase